ncbi:histidine kinase [Streptomyces sp. GbtcB7]|uniref:sensor histidine kinase n=1 Tax=Streptomyces sp. GbtcB7 TaxID=2824752 RepID=UPI001C30A8D6|nr:histidine kinase [Streptomyces sp. GbtcB7]
MTAPTAPGPTSRPVTPEKLLGGAQHRSDVAVLQWLARVRRADLAHPWVKRVTAPLLCAALGVPALRDAADGIGRGVPVVLALIVGYCVPLLWRQQRPVLVFALTSAVGVVGLVMDVSTGSEAARIVALLNVGRTVGPAQLVVCMAIAVGQTSVGVVARAAGQPGSTFLETAVLAIVQAALVAAVAAAGLVGRVVNAYVGALHERAFRLEVERDQRSRLAAAAERARVAREMHDILGHTLAVIVGLAGGAAGLAEKSPKRGADTLRIIADSGRGALGELRRLLAVIGEEGDGSDEPGGTPLAPQPGLADLAALLERVRAAGPTVTLGTEGDLTGLAPGIQLAVYRIVQEALTNTLKHAAPDTTAHVGVTVDRDRVRLTVDDTGPPRTPRADNARDDARGLVGMRERAALYQGTVTAGPNPHGGWTVHALLIPTTAPTENHPA